MIFENFMQMLIPIFCQSCNDMISKLDKVVTSSNGPCDLDVWPFVQNVSSDVLARAGFGSSFEEGKRVFQLQKEMISLTMTLFKFAFIPGYRLDFTAVRFGSAIRFSSLEFFFKNPNSNRGYLLLGSCQLIRTEE